MTPEPASGTSKSAQFDVGTFIAAHGGGVISAYNDRQTVYAQGDPANAVFYLIAGTAKVTIVSEHGKEAVISFLGPGDFFGEECLDGHLLRNAAVTATSRCEIVRFDRDFVIRTLKEDPTFSNILMRFILERKHKLQADLIDQLFNSSEKRLARILLALASVGYDNQSGTVPYPVTQETLANMIGTTRARVNQFMAKFRKLGYIDYNRQIRVHNSLINIIVRERQHGADH
jgi:CRP/FNR family transcriptional regulator, cyclic AMP receptor protein